MDAPSHMGDMYVYMCRVRRGRSDEARGGHEHWGKISELFSTSVMVYSTTSFNSQTPMFQVSGSVTHSSDNGISLWFFFIPLSIKLKGIKYLSFLSF